MELFTYVVVILPSVLFFFFFQAYAVILFCCTLVAILMGALRSINVFHEKSMSEDSLVTVAQYLDWNITNPKLALLATQPTLGGKITFWICSAFLCIDTSLRLILCPKKGMYFKSIFSYGEIMHLVGFILIESIFSSGAVKIESGPAVLWAFIILQAMEGLKVAKLFRLGLNIPSVKLMHVSLLSSYRELLFLFMVVLVFTSLLGPLVFLVEYTTDGNINDMFTSFWWATITMTTVGYGDNYPITFGGRIVGIVCAVIGVLILAMPIGILASSFNDKHFNYKLLDKHCERRKKKKEAPVSADTYILTNFK